MWSSWPGNRDADVDVYSAVLRSARKGTEPFILLVERCGRPDALLVGESQSTEISHRIGYLTLSTSSVRSLSFTYGGFLGNQSRENAEVLTSKILEFLHKGEADVAQLNFIRTDSSLYRCVLTSAVFFSRDHFIGRRQHWVMDLPGTMGEVYSRLSGAQRSQLRRKTKKLQMEFGGAIQIRRYGEPSGLEVMIRDLETVAQRTYQRGLRVGFEKSAAILNLLQLEAEKGWLRAYILYLEMKPCASWVGCIYDGVFYSDFLAHDPAYGAYSPGTFLLTQTTADLCENKLVSIDFGIDEARYKHQFGNRCWTESATQLFAPSLKGTELLLAASAASFTSRFVKGFLERTALLSTVKKFLRRRAAPET